MLEADVPLVVYHLVDYIFVDRVLHVHTLQMHRVPLHLGLEAVIIHSTAIMPLHLSAPLIRLLISYLIQLVHGLCIIVVIYRHRPEILGAILRIALRNSCVSG